MLLFISSVAQAQSPPDAGSLLRQQEQLEQKTPQRFPEIEVPEFVRPALKEVEGVKVLVKAIRFSGALDLVPETELQALVRDAIGSELNFTDLQNLTYKVTEYLRSKGYLLARAYLPRQDVTEGVIEIAILKGRLDGAAGEGGGWEVTLGEGARIDPERLTGIGESAAPSGSTVRRAELERALLLMKDLPGVNARSRLEPGAETGTTRIVVNVAESPLRTGNVWADNYGNSSTGEEQLNAQLSFNDPSGRGDQVSLTATASEGIRLARLGYDLPVGYKGLRVNAGYTHMRYEVVDGASVAAGLEGESRIIHAGVAYPFIRGRLFNFRGNFNVDHKKLKDDSNAGTLRDKTVNVATLGLGGDSIDKWQGGGLNGWSVNFTLGDLDLSGVAADEAADAASLRTQGNYYKLSWYLSRLQKLPRNLTLLGRLSGQWTNNNLDSSEEFILGGPAGVRAYPVNEASGDEGWLASLELRYDKPGSTRWGALQFSAFADSGHIRLHDDPGNVAISTATGKNSYGISGIGLGVSLTKTASHSLRLAWAHTLGNNPGRTVNDENADGKRTNNRFWLQGIVWF